MLLAAYPHLTGADIQAAAHYAAESLAHEEVMRIESLIRARRRCDSWQMRVAILRSCMHCDRGGMTFWRSRRSNKGLMTSASLSWQGVAFAF